MGVHWDKNAHINQGNGGAWRATFSYSSNGKKHTIHLGYFLKKEDAEETYAWVKEHGLIRVTLNGGRHYQIRDDPYYTWRDQFGTSLRDWRMRWPERRDTSNPDNLEYEFLWKPEK